MTPKFRNGKPLFWNGNPAFCCCGEGGCAYIITATVTQSLDGSAAHIYGEIDGGPVVYYDNIQDPPGPADDVIYWNNAVGSEAVATGTAFTGGAHTFRFWWALADNGSVPTTVTATITITIVSPSEICANGNTVNDANPEIVLDFVLFRAPGDGDQSAYDGGYIVEVVCGACADPEMAEALTAIGLGNGFEFLANNPEFQNVNL